jgi:hypothetical protein
MNKSQLDEQYRIAVQGLDQASVWWRRAEAEAISHTVEAGQIGEFNVIVSLPSSAKYRRSQKATLVISEVHGDRPETVLEETRFLAPPKQ